LDDATIKRLEQALSRATGLEIEAQIVVDPAVLGGIQAKVGDRLIDGTIRSRLQQMKAAM
jgi:F-type H+-transporting ATPase subunit delta